MKTLLRPIAIGPEAPGRADVVSRARTAAAVMFDAAAASDASAAFAPRAVRALRQAGLLIAPFPTALGGDDLLAVGRRDDLVDVLRLIGGGDLSIGRLFEGHVNAVDLLCRYGSALQVERLAADVADGAMMGVWGAEDAVGLTARCRGGQWHLDGRKILASGAGYLTRPLVTAGSRMLLLRLEAGERSDLSGWTAQGMRATATGTVDLTGMILDDDQILGSDGDFMRQPHFSGGAWRFCAVHLGGMERLVDGFRAHLSERRRDGDAYQLQRVAHCVAGAATAKFWIAAAARRQADPTENPDRVVAFTNLTRMVTERAALDILEAVHRGVGLQGFMRPHPIERVSRDLATYLRQPVPDLAMADAARAVMASPRATGELWSAP